MACCVLTAYFMHKIIESLELFNVKLIDIKYNDFDDVPTLSASETDLSVVTFTIDGMTCTACTSAIQDAANKLVGLHTISISLPLGEATILYDASKLQASEIEQTINAVGYDATPVGRSPEARADHLEHGEALSKLRSSVMHATILACGIATTDAILKFTGEQKWLTHISTALGLWVILGNAAFIHTSAWRNLKVRHLTMDTLTSLSLILSVGMTIFHFQLFGIDRARKYASSGAYLATVILCGRYIELMLRRKGAASFTNLYRLQNDTAKVYSATRGAKVPAMLLQPQDEIVLAPHDIIPVDCYVLQGSSLVDQSVMTGESRPVSKTTGDQLLAGTKNISGRLVAVVTKSQKYSSLQQLVDSITSSLESTAEAGNVFSNLISHFVCFVLLLAAFSFLWTCARSDLRQLDRLQLINKACERLMAVLASACPCALGLAAPTAMMAGIDTAWRRGVMVTNSVQTFTKLTRLTHIVMDKTGTLTEGKLRVTSVWRPESGDLTHAEVYMILCAVERTMMQTHPVASAIFRYALNQLDDEQRLRQNEIETRSHNLAASDGIVGEVRFPDSSQWRRVVCGSSRFVSENGTNGDGVWKSSTHTNSTEAFLHIDGTFAAHITLQDTIRSEAPLVINELRKSGLQVSMLTGDVDEEAERVCSELAIPLLAARSLNKKKHIKALQQTRHVVAMIGDGFNDLSAQAQADVGIHLKLQDSTSTSASAAQVLFSSPDLSHLPDLLNIARMTMRQSRINLVWAFSYNAIALSLALGVGEQWGLSVDAAMAGSMMALSSVTVMVLSLHLRHRLGNIPVPNCAS